MSRSRRSSCVVRNRAILTSRGVFQTWLAGRKWDIISRQRAAESGNECLQPLRLTVSPCFTATEDLFVLVVFVFWGVVFVFGCCFCF